MLHIYSSWRSGAIGYSVYWITQGSNHNEKIIRIRIHLNGLFNGEICPPFGQLWYKLNNRFLELLLLICYCNSILTWTINYKSSYLIFIEPNKIVFVIWLPCTVSDSTNSKMFLNFELAFFLRFFYQYLWKLLKIYSYILLNK